VFEVLSFVPLLIMHTWSFFFFVCCRHSTFSQESIANLLSEAGQTATFISSHSRRPALFISVQVYSDCRWAYIRESQFCRTLKEAETAAAKVALMSLPQEASLPEQSMVGPFLILSCLTNGAFS
jgi:hypothetical protein